MAFSPDGNTLASGSYNGTLKLWDMPAREEIATLNPYQQWVSSVAFSPDGNTLVSGSWDGKIELWNVAARETIMSYKGGCR